MSFRRVSVHSKIAALRGEDDVRQYEARAEGSRAPGNDREDDSNRVHEYAGDEEITGLRRFMSKTGHCYIKRVRF